MNIPPIQGKMITADTVVFIAADENYFNLYAKPLIRSVQTHLTIPVHLHLYNPSTNTQQWCNDHYVDFSFEHFDTDTLEPSVNRWLGEQTDEISRYKKGRMTKDLIDDVEKLRREVTKTYYACTRFIRLSELIKTPTYIIMLDTDSIIRSKFNLPSTEADVHIFEKNHKKHVPYMQHLASTIFYTGTKDSFNLINNHAKLIQDEYLKDELYWFLDQDTLDIAIQKCKKLPLSQSLVDFNMGESSPIWCAKGPRKFKDIYLNEIKKYS